jgi:hypothetical protein
MVAFMVGYHYKAWLTIDSYVLVRDHLFRLAIIWFEYLFLNATPFLPRQYPFIFLLYAGAVGLNWPHLVKMVDYCTMGAYGDDFMATGVVPVAIITYSAFMMRLLQFVSMKKMQRIGYHQCQK